MSDSLRETMERLQGLIAKATPGPWVATERSGYRELLAPDNGCDWFGHPKHHAVAYIDTEIDDGEQEANASLIVEAVNALPDLLAQYEAAALRASTDAAPVAGEDVSLVKARRIVDTVTEFCRGSDFSCDMKTATKAILPLLKALSDPPATDTAQAEPVGLREYDAGLLNDFGGGDVDWWQDYLRAEIERANDWWRSQLAAISTFPARTDEPIPAEATDAMVEAGLTTGARFGPDAMRNIWRTMHAAALSANSARTDEGEG